MTTMMTTTMPTTKKRVRRPRRHKLAADAPAAIWRREVMNYLGNRPDESGLDPEVPQRPRVCSIYWAEQIASRGPTVYAPRSECHCPNCRNANVLPGQAHRLWPDSTIVHVSDESQGRQTRRVRMSSECQVELLAPPEEEKRKVSVKEAHRVGLSYTSSKRAHLLMTLMIGCERCGGLRPQEQRYCLACSTRMTADLRQAGWSDAAIAAWCAGAEFESIGMQGS